MIKIRQLMFVASLFIFIINVCGQKAIIKNSADKTEKAEEIEVLEPENNFAEKGLPEPAIIGLNPSAELAAKIAKEISRYDENSLPLLIAALQKAGFYIMDENQKILYKPIGGDGQGVAFYDFEVVGMLKASKMGAGTSVRKLAELISQNNQALPADLIVKMILKDLKTASLSADPQVEFLANLIFGFGTNFPNPVDLKNASPEKSGINIIQASLIERVLLGELLTSYEEFSGGNALFKKDRFFSAPQNSGYFIKASFKNTGGGGGCPALDDLTTFQNYEKNIRKVAKAVKIYKELATKWGIEVKDVKSPEMPIGFTSEEGFKKFAKGVSVVNVALAWVKFVAALANVKARIDVEDPLPLIRTKSSRQPGGEVRLLTGEFKMDIGNTEKINCVGKALEAVSGIKFSLPKGGSLADKPVSWELLDIGEGPAKYTSTPVYLDSLDKTDLSKQMTNANGESKAKLTGKPQSENLENQPLVPLAKKAVIKVSIALEKMNLKDDAPKIGKLLLGVEIDPLSIIEIIPDMLGKIKLSTFRVRVPVRDWQPCSEDWGGTINYTRYYSQTIIVKSNRSSNGNSTGDGVRKITQLDVADITLNPRKPEDIQTTDPLPADIAVHGRHLDVFEGRRGNDPCCGKNLGDFDTTFRSGTEDTYNAVFKKRVSVNYRGGERDHSLAFDFASDQINAVRKTFYEIISSSCPLEYDNAESEYSDFIIFLQGILPEGRYGQRFANTAGEILQGEKIQNAPDGAKITWNWSLARCKK